MDCTVHAILQARILEWIPPPGDLPNPGTEPTSPALPAGFFTTFATWEALIQGCAVCLVVQSCLTLCDPMDCSPPGSSDLGDSPGKNPGVGYHALLQGIFPTQGLNPGFLHCRWILYHLSHQESSRILGWVAYPFYRGSSGSRNRTGVSCIVGGFFTTWSTREAQYRGGWCWESSNYQCWWTYSQILVSIKGTTFLGDVKNIYTPSESKISLWPFILRNNFKCVH